MKQILILVFVCISIASIHAQTDLPTDQVEVLKNFEVELAKSERVQINAPQAKIEAKQESYTYDVNLKPLKLDYPAPYIRPIAHKNTNKVISRKGYIKAGYGSLANPFVYGSYDLGVPNYYQLGIKGSFESMNQSNVTNKKQSAFDVTLNSKYFITQSLITDLSIIAERSKNHFFGFNDMNLNEPITEDNRTNGNYGLNLGLTKYFGSKKQTVIGLKTAYMYSNVSDLELNENNVELNPFIVQKLGDNLAFTVNSSANFSFFKYGLSQTQDNFNNHLYEVSPKLDWAFGNSNISVGLDYFKDLSSSYILPSASIGVNGIGKLVNVKLVAVNEINKNNINRLFTNNPFFLELNDDLRNTIKSSYFLNSDFIVKQIDFDFQLGFHHWENYNLYLNNPDLPTRFDILQDDITAKYLSLKVGYPPMKNLNISLSSQYNIYTLSEQAEAWHMPSLEMSLMGSYVMLDSKLRLETRLDFQNGANTINLDGETMDLGSLWSMNLNVDYDLTKSITTFIEGQNLFSSDYQFWYGYPIFGANVRAGVKWVF